MEINKLTRNDFYITFGLVLLAFLVRVPNFSQISQPVFDEAHYANFAIRTLNGERYIDVHPPLGRIIFAFLAKIFKSEGDFNEIKYGSDYGNFPFKALRMATIIAGSLLCGIIFLIARKIYSELSLAVLAALLVIFDGFLIIYSRFILPDTYLLVFGFLGILFFLSALGSKKKSALFFIFIAGLFFGFAGLIKWSGFGFLGAAIFFSACRILNREIDRSQVFLGTLAERGLARAEEIFSRKLSVVPKTSDESRFRGFQHRKEFFKILALLFFAIATYILIFTAFSFTGQGDHSYFSFIAQAKKMTEGHLKLQDHVLASRPYLWPFMQMAFPFWHSEGITISLSPNLVGWVSVVLSIILGFFIFITVNYETLSRRTFWRAQHKILLNFCLMLAPSRCASLSKICAIGKFRNSKFITENDKFIWLLIGGYFINYLPYFFIPRTLYIYLYMPSLIFGYLLIPRIISFLEKTGYAKSRVIFNTFSVFVVFSYALFIPFIYGL